MTLMHLRWFVAVIFACAIPVSASTLSVRHCDAPIMPLAIAEDFEGFLWLATPTGVLRFDGMHFESIRPHGFDLTGATQIASGTDGSIWIGAEKASFDGIAASYRWSFLDASKRC